MTTQPTSEGQRFRCRWYGCPGNHRTERRQCKPPAEKCEDCGGEKKWCPVCSRWTKTCCVEYGTCQCS